MSNPNLSFKVALITGGAGGIGLTLAQWLQKQDKKVIIAGRTASKLEEASKKQLSNCPYYVLDTGAVSAIPAFIERVTAEHPDLDCLINNAGVQRPLSVIDDTFDLAKADQEIDINIRGPLHLTIGLLPHLRKQSHPLIVNVSSVLGFVPFSVINPVYNGTKAWVHFWSVNLRTQLQQLSTKDSSGGSEGAGGREGGGGMVRVLEIVPPTVETDLHRERTDPDDNKKQKGASSSLSLEEFMADVGKQWMEGEREVLAPEMARGFADRWEGQFGAEYLKMTGGQKK